MGRITALFARKVVAAAGAAVDADALLASVGLAPAAEPDVAEMIDADAYYGLLERIAHVMAQGETLPLSVGASMRCDDYGAFGLAWKSAPTLRASLARAERYGRLLTSVAAYEVAPQERGALMILHRAGPRRLGLRLSNEATIASIVTIIREVSAAPFHPLAVFFKHAPPPRLAAHRAWFGCAPQFGAEIDGLLIGSADLAQPNRLGDEGMTRFLLRHLEAELEHVAEPPTLRDSVRETVARTLCDGAPKMADVARRLGLSQRTLHRRLAAEGAAFQQIVDDARRGVAEGLLRGSDYPLVEIAFLTGFSDQTAFNRAFRRWRNETPAAFRANAAG